MIVPNFKPNYEGDIVFSFTNVSESKKESNKRIYDRKNYLSEITIDPINDKVINKKCECQGFIFRGECKHINQNIQIVNKLLKGGVK